jgi:tetraacyldisaccharide 4'-kinase
MVRNALIKFLLLPFSLIWGALASFRNYLYDREVLRSSRFDLPVISIGNLSVGGAGKTPHVEYLIVLLKDYIQVATLSRGYKRKTTGYLEVLPQMTSDDCGDEPLQFKRKFPEAHVAVSESRIMGIPRLVGSHPDTQVVLLDDAFQHRAVEPYLNILLTEYAHPYYDDFMLPSGRLREWSSSASRADVIIVTKCPKDSEAVNKNLILDKLKPNPGQEVFFSYYEYGNPYYMYDGSQRIAINDQHNVLLVTAIANAGYLTQHLEERVNFLRNISFEDHHDFSRYDISRIKKIFDNMEHKAKYILTTEKDAMRLDKHREFLIQQALPVFILPLRVRFHFDDGIRFDTLIQNKLLEYKS